MISVKEKVKLGLFDKRKIATFVFQRIFAGEAIILNAKGAGKKMSKKDYAHLMSKYNKSKWKLKEILPIDSVYIQKAKKFVILF